MAAASLQTLKASKTRLFGTIRAIHQVENSTSKVAVIAVDGFEALEIKVKLGNLRLEISGSTHDTVNVPETPAGLVDYESDQSDSSNDNDGDDVDVDGHDEGESAEQQWIDEEVRIDARISGGGYRQALVFTLPNPGSCSALEFFKHFLPTDYIEQHVIYAINCYAALLEIEYWKQLTMGEFMLWIGLWTIMAIAPFPNRRKYWETKPSFLFSKATNFGKWMSKRRFDTILQALTLEHPDVIASTSSTDPLVAIRSFVKAYNDNFV